MATGRAGARELCQSEAVSSGKAPKVEPAPDQHETYRNLTIVHSISGLGLGKVEEAMEVVPSEVLLAPADVITDVVQSSESTGV